MLRLDRTLVALTAAVMATAGVERAEATLGPDNQCLEQVQSVTEVAPTSTTPVTWLSMTMESTAPGPEPSMSEGPLLLQRRPPERQAACRLSLGGGPECRADGPQPASQRGQHTVFDGSKFSGGIKLRLPARLVRDTTYGSSDVLEAAAGHLRGLFRPPQVLA